MTTTIAIEDVRREVKILRALIGHSSLVQFYNAYEDQENVYVTMEGRKYTEDDAKALMIHILNVIAFCHLQGVVHRDLKPECRRYTSLNTRLSQLTTGNLALACDIIFQ